MCWYLSTIHYSLTTNLFPFSLCHCERPTGAWQSQAGQTLYCFLILLPLSLYYSRFLMSFPRKCESILFFCFCRGQIYLILLIVGLMNQTPTDYYLLITYYYILFIIFSGNLSFFSYLSLLDSRFRGNDRGG